MALLRPVLRTALVQCRSLHRASTLFQTDVTRQPGEWRYIGKPEPFEPPKKPAERPMPSIIVGILGSYTELREENIYLNWLPEITPDYNKYLIDKRTYTGWRHAYLKGYHETAGYYQLGLMEHDVFNDETNSEISEAVRRLREDPNAKDIYDARTFRTIRAAHLDAQGFKILPESDWMTFEEDEPYLFPYLKQVRDEVEERRRYVWRTGHE